MSERYWISGVQIGLIKVLIEGDWEKRREVSGILKQIEDNQFIGSSKYLKRLLKEDEKDDI